MRPSVNPMVGSVFPILIFFLTMIFSGFLEKLPFLNGLHILTILGGIALVVIFLSGRYVPVVKHPIASPLLIFTVWLIVGIPFSVWPGGSYAIWSNMWSKSVLSFVMVAGCIQTIKEVKTVYKTMGYSIGVLSVMALLLNGRDVTGRLGLLDTRYENANDFGWTLILGLSFLLYLFKRGTGWEKLTSLALSAPIMLALVRTGSRGSMVGLAVLALVEFLDAKRTTKIQLAIAVPVLAILLLFITPQDLRSRYTTIFGAGENTALTGEYLSRSERLQNTAAGSAEARWTMIKDSIYLTMHHPVMGVGPGVFQVAQVDLAMARGETRGAWRVTHNTFTQISSEMGLPGLAIYLWFLYECFKSLNWIIRSRVPGKSWDELRAQATALRVTFFMVTAVAMFGSYAYDTNIPILGGMACALSLMAKQRYALQSRQAAAAQTPTALAELEAEPVAAAV